MDLMEKLAFICLLLMAASYAWPGEVAYRTLTCNTTASTALAYYPCVFSLNDTTNSSRYNSSTWANFQITDVNNGTQYPFNILWPAQQGGNASTNMTVRVAANMTGGANTTLIIHYLNVSAASQENETGYANLSGLAAEWDLGDNRTISPSGLVPNLTLHHGAVSFVQNSSICAFGGVCAYTTANGTLQITNLSLLTWNNYTVVARGWLNNTPTNYNSIFTREGAGSSTSSNNGVGLRLEDHNFNCWRDNGSLARTPISSVSNTSMVGFNTYACVFNTSLVAAVNSTQNSSGPYPAINAGNTTITLGGATGDAIDWSNNGAAAYGEIEVYNTAQSSDWLKAEVAQNWAVGAYISLVAPASIVSQPVVVNGTGSHSFIVNATATSGSSWGSASINISTGSCVVVQNTTSGSNLTTAFNCSYNVSPSTPSFNMTFTDSANTSATTNTLTNAYPDHVPSLGAPAISPNPANASNTLNCTPGAFSDPDGDLENTSAEVFQWWQDGALIAGQTNSTLAPGNFRGGSVVQCTETATNSTWSASTATTNSSAVAIFFDLSHATVVLVSPANGSTTGNNTTNSWQNLTANDTANNITYLLCTNTTALSGQVCVVGISGTSYNLSNAFGAVVQWSVQGYNGVNYSNPSAQWFFIVNSTAIVPPVFSVPDLDTSVSNLWGMWGQWILIMIAAGVAYLAGPTLSGSAFILGVELGLIAVFSSSLIVGALAVACIVGGALLKAAGR